MTPTRAILWTAERLDGVEQQSGVTSRCVVEFLDIVRVSCVDYAALSSGMATSSSFAVRSFMECSEK